MQAQSLSCVQLCDLMDCSPPGSSVHGIFQAKYWSRLPFPTPGDLPNPGMKPTSLIFPALAGGFFTTEPLGKSVVYINNFFFLFYCWITLQSTNILWLVYPLHLLDY